MKKNNVLEFAGRATIPDPLTALLRSGAQQLINQAVEAELQELLSQHSERCTEGGHAVVVRNGHLPERELQTGLGPVTVRIPTPATMLDAQDDECAQLLAQIRAGEGQGFIARHLAGRDQSGCRESLRPVRQNV